MNWKTAKPAAYRALRASLVLEDPAFQKGADDDIRALATQMVQYWKATAEGELLTQQLIETAIHRARLLCSAVGIEGQGKAQRVQRIIGLFAYIGVELISVFDNGGNDGEEEK